MGFLSSFFAATPENPRFNLNSPEAWDMLWGGTKSSTGVAVNSESALGYSPWWRAIDLISGYVAKTPLYIYKRTNPDGKEPATTHDGYQLLRWKANERMTAQTFWKLMIAHKMSAGNAYAYIFRRGDGAPLELLPLDTNATTPVLEDGVLWYVTQVGKEKRKLTAVDVLHFKGLSFDGLVGYSVIEKARETLGLGMGARGFAAAVFRNSGRPPVILKFPTKLADDVKQAIVRSWERMNAGIDNAGRTAILDGGLEAQELTFNPEDAQLLQSREFNVYEVANYTGAPPHKIGAPTPPTIGSRESQNQALIDDCLDDHFVGIEQECRDKLLAEEEKAADSHTLEFLRASLVQGDTTAVTNLLRTALGGRAWMTVNEARAMQNLNPDPSPDSSVILTPLNMGQGGPDNQPAEPKPPTPPAKPEPPKKKAEAAFLRDVTMRMVRRIGAQAKAAAEKPKTFADWVDGMRDQNESAFAEAFAGVERVVDAEPGHVAAWLLSVLGPTFAKTAEQATEKTLRAKVADVCQMIEASVPDAAAKNWIKGD